MSTGENDPDTPIPALRDFELDPDPVFRAAIRRDIDRRITAAEVIRLSTLAFGQVLLEWFSLATSAAPKPPSSDEE